MKIMSEELEWYEAFICDIDQIKAGKQHPRKVSKALRLMSELASYLEDNDMSLHCGGCKDHALLLSDHGGVYLGSQRTQVWSGGDVNMSYKNGISYESSHEAAGEF